MHQWICLDELYKLMESFFQIQIRFRLIGQKPKNIQTGSEASILIKKQFYASSIQPLHPSHLIVTSPTDPCPLKLRAILQASYHRILRGLRVRSDDPSSLVACWKRWRLPLSRRLLQGRMIEEIVLSQAPNKVIMATPPPIDPTAAPILPKRPLPAPIRLLLEGRSSPPPFRRLGQ